MTIHTDPDAQHATYPPSGAFRWTVCTASAEAIAMLPPEEEGEAAKEGTAAHEELERVLGGGTANPDHDAAHAVALAVSYVRQLWANKTVDDRIWIEQRVVLTDQIWGRCDVAHWHDESRTLTIVDLKNGQRAVDVEENEQLRIYAAASMFTHKLPVKWIRYVICQPRDWRPFVPRVKQWIEPVDALYEWAERVSMIPKKPLTFIAGDHCRDCPLFGKCSASLDMLANIGALVSGLVQPENVRPEQVAAFLATRKPVEDTFKKFEKVWQGIAFKGAVPPGMKLVATRPHRAWLDEGWARDFVVNKFGVSALAPPTPAQVEQMGATKQEIEGLVHQPEGGPALAFENDKRKPFERKSVEAMFGGVATS